MEVTKQKNPKRVEAGKRSYEKQLLKMKQSILADNPSSNTSNPSSNTSNLSSSDSSSLSSSSSNPSSNDSSSLSSNTGNASSSLSSNTSNVSSICGVVTVLSIACAVYFYTSRPTQTTSEDRHNAHPTPASGERHNPVGHKVQVQQQQHRPML